MKDIVWFNYQDDKSDVWNVEIFMRELGSKLDLLIERSNLIDVLKSYKQEYKSYTRIKDNVMLDDIIAYFRRQKIRDIFNDTNSYYNLNIGKLEMAGFTAKELKGKINFLNMQWQLLPDQINIKSYQTLCRLLTFLSALSLFTELLRLIYFVFAASNLVVSFLNSDLWEIFHRMNGDWFDENDLDEFV